MRKTLVLFIKLIIGLGIVYWLIVSNRLDLSRYLQMFNKSTAWFIVGAIAAQALSLTLILGRWWLLVRVQGVQISLATALRISYQGMFASLLMPGVLGLDGMRVLHIQRNFRNQLAPSLASMILDRALGLFGLLVLGVTFGLVFVAQHKSQQSVELLFWMLLGLGLMAILLAVACGFIPMKGLQFIRRIRFFRSFLDALAVYRSHHFALALAIMLSIAGHFLVIVGSCFGLATLGLDFSLLAVAIVTPLLIVIRFIPLTPLGLGVTDFAAEELYLMVGIEGGAEVQMLLRATWILILLACGLAFFGSMRKYHPTR